MIRKIDDIKINFTQLLEYCKNTKPEVYNDVYEEVIGYDAGIRTSWEKKVQGFYSKAVTDFMTWRPDILTIIDNGFLNKHNINKEKCWGRIIMTPPGHFSPPHIDVCPSAPRNLADKDTVSRTDILEENKKTIRLWIPLQDAAVGHIFYGKEWAINNWRKGEVYVWDRDEIHGLVNAGITDRYVLTVTGYFND